MDLVWCEASCYWLGSSLKNFMGVSDLLLGASFETRPTLQSHKIQTNGLPSLPNRGCEMGNVSLGKLFMILEESFLEASSVPHDLQYSR